MVSQFTKGHNSIKVVDGVMVLNLCTSSDDVLCFIFVPSFKKKSQMVSELPYKFYVLGQTGLSKQCRPRSDCF